MNMDADHSLEAVQAQMDKSDQKNHLPNVLDNCLLSQFDPIYILKEAKKELKCLNRSKTNVSEESVIFKALTLYEYNNGVLLSATVPVAFKTFGINFLRQLQIEYDCKTESEKATAELVVLTYIRILDIQRKINDYSGKSLNKTDVAFYSVLSKELDRANRQYINALNMLKMMKQPPIHFNIKTETAIIGKNQMIQENKND